jgi:hypothetical protein
MAIAADKAKESRPNGRMSPMRVPIKSAPPALGDALNVGLASFWTFLLNVLMGVDLGCKDFECATTTYKCLLSLLA